MFNESSAAVLERVTDSHVATGTAGGRKGAKKAFPATVKIDQRRGDAKLIMESIHATEQISLMAKSLYEQLCEKGLDTQAYQAWAIHREASHSAEQMGEAIGVEVDVD